MDTSSCSWYLLEFLNFDFDAFGKPIHKSIKVSNKNCGILMLLVSTLFWVSGRRRSPAGLGRPGPGSRRPPPCSCAAPSPPPPPPPAPAQSCCPAAAWNRCQLSTRCHYLGLYFWNISLSQSYRYQNQQSPCQSLQLNWCVWCFQNFPHTVELLEQYWTMQID